MYCIIFMGLIFISISKSKGPWDQEHFFCISSRVLCTQQELRKYLCIVSCWHLFIFLLALVTLHFPGFPPTSMSPSPVQVSFLASPPLLDLWILKYPRIYSGPSSLPSEYFPPPHPMTLNTIYMMMISTFIIPSLIHPSPHANYRYILNCLLKFPLGSLKGILNLTCSE